MIIKKNIWSAVFASLLVIIASAQGEGNTWYFGAYAGLSFSTDPPTLLNDGHLTTYEGCASVSGKDGVLAFYTDGRTVWDRNHNVMPNGTGLMGNPSSTQSAVICPKPGTYNYGTKRYDGYYIITVEVSNGTSQGGSNAGVRFTEVNMTLNGGTGDVVASNKNIHLFGTTTIEGVNVAKHANGCDYWIIGKEVGTTNVRTYHISPTGVNMTPIISTSVFVGSSSLGSIKVSPNSKLVSIVNYPRGIEIFDFDNATGILTSKFTDNPGGSNYSSEFSPNNEVLYYTEISGVNIYQYDLTVANNAAFVASRIIVGSTPSTSNSYEVCALQMAPNGKIYVALQNRARLGVIENPNVLGVGCTYNDNGVSLAGVNTFANANMVSQLGLPAFPSFFVKEPVVIRDTNVCFQDQTKLKLSDTTDVNTIAWYWNSLGTALPSTPNSTDWEPLVTFPSAGDYQVMAIATYPCFVDSIIDTVTIYAKPQAEFTYTNSCFYDSLPFVDASTVTAPDLIVSYAWYFGENVIPSVEDTRNNPKYEYATAGIYNVVEVVMTDKGCVDTVIHQVEAYAKPTAQFSVPTSCTTAPVNFAESSTATGSATITTWNWNYGDGVGTSTNQNDTYTYTTAGSYPVELIVTDDNGCKDTLQQNITINEMPQIAFTMTTAGCLGDTVFYTDGSTITAPDNITTWNWDVQNDEVIDFTTQNGVYVYPSAGTYDVTLEVVSNNGCTASLTQQVTINPLPQVSFSASTECVNGAPTRFVNTSSIASGNNVLFGWSFGDGDVSTTENPMHDYAIAASYPVTLRVVSDMGCVDSVTYSVDVLGKPTAQFVQDTTGGCPTICANFTDQSFDDVPITAWNWQFENNFGEGNEQHPTYCYTTEGTYDVGLIVTNAQGCKDTVIQVGLMTLFPSPFSDFTLSPTSTDVLNAQIDFTNNSIDAAAWIWNFADGTPEDYSNYDPSHVFGDTGHFEVELVAINNFLCTDTSYQIVEILPVDELFVPSAFSPNGDGKNDRLYARGYIGTMYFAVFDRLGNKMFETEDKNYGWDGTINGKPAIEGVYSWYLQAEVNGKPRKMKGDVTLVR